MRCLAALLALVTLVSCSAPSPIAASATPARTASAAATASVSAAATSAASASAAARPAFLSTAFTNVRDGSRFTLSDFGGRTVLVIGMAVW